MRIILSRDEVLACQNALLKEELNKRPREWTKSARRKLDKALWHKKKSWESSPEVKEKGRR